MEIETAKEIVKCLRDTPGFIEMVEGRDPHWFSSLACTHHIDQERQYTRTKTLSGWKFDPYAHGLPLKYDADAVLEALEFVNAYSNQNIFTTDECDNGGSYYAVYCRYPGNNWYMWCFRNASPNDFYKFVTSSGLGWMSVSEAYTLQEYMSDLAMLFDTKEKAEEFIKSSKAVKFSRENNPGVEFKVRQHP